MKVLIITVAGMSSRFSQSLGKEYLKCIYYTGTIQESLLYRILSQPIDFDKYIIVGGYKYDELTLIIENYFKRFKEKIILVNNEKFAEYGSGYSLYLGLREAIRLQPKDVIFAEGDLYVDQESYLKVCNSDHSVITYNSEPIRADKSVVFYYDQNYNLHYIYDTKHNALKIEEPFLSIYNSGQIWKFNQFCRLENIFYSLNQREWQGTNLILIERYFSQLKRDAYDLVGFNKWINCNTIYDFNRI